MSDEVRMLAAARFAVTEAAIVCRAVQKRLAAGVRLTKSDNSPVTIADFAAQAVIARALAERLGAVTLVGEESSEPLRAELAAGRPAFAEAVVDAARLVWPDATMDEVLAAIDAGAADPPRGELRGFWTVDPIDGTKGYLRGGQYAICLAWVEHGSPVLGVVACPNLPIDQSLPLDEPDPRGSLYYAIASEGLCEAPADDPAAKALPIRRLEPAENEPVRLVESIDASHSSHSDSERVLERLGEPAEPVRLDGQTKYAIVARGQADLFLRVPARRSYVERIWDHAAGAIIATEAGCCVTDIRGEPFDFSRGRGLEANVGVLVAPPALHGRALGALTQLDLNNGAR